MPDPFRTVKPGQPLRLTAEAWNAAAAAGLAHRQAQLRRSTSREAVNRATLARVRNDSGGDVERGDVLTITGLIFDPTDNEAIFYDDPPLTGDLPSTDPETDRCGPPAVAIEPIPDGSIGLCVVHGLAACTVSIADAAHRFADFADGQHYLTSADYGPWPIIGREAGTGPRLAAVLIGPRDIERVLKVEADSAVTAGSSGTFSVLGAGDVDTGRNITAQNPFADIPTGGLAHATWIVDHWEISAGECA